MVALRQSPDGREMVKQELARFVQQRGGWGIYSALMERQFPDRDRRAAAHREIVTHAAAAADGLENLERELSTGLSKPSASGDPRLQDLVVALRQCPKGRAIVNRQLSQLARDPKRARSYNTFIMRQFRNPAERKALRRDVASAPYDLSKKHERLQFYYPLRHLTWKAHPRFRSMEERRQVFSRLVDRQVRERPGELEGEIRRLIGDSLRRGLWERTMERLSLWETTIPVAEQLGFVLRALSRSGDRAQVSLFVKHMASIQDQDQRLFKRLLDLTVPASRQERFVNQILPGFRSRAQTRDDFASDNGQASVGRLDRASVENADFDGSLDAMGVRRIRPKSSMGCAAAEEG
jgi:hypothetical protein